MEKEFQITGTSLIIHLPAEVDHHSDSRLKETADRLIQEENIRRIVFDFEQTGFMDSSGIGMIVGRYKNIRFMGGTVIAIRVSERIRRLLTMSGIYKVMDIYEDLPRQSGLL